MCEAIKSGWGNISDSTTKLDDYRLKKNLPQFSDSEEEAEVIMSPVMRGNSVTFATISNGYTYDAVKSDRLSRIEEDIRGLKAMIQEAINKDRSNFPTTIPIQLFSLPSDKYKLRSPVNIIVEKYDDEVLALLPELTLCGEGENEFEAIDDLKTDIIELLEDLEDTPEADLGKAPKLWKRSLELIVEKCQ
ncbi:MAG: hypothetical protein JXA35_05280 [Deltaproteobacteria bacterium]|nr:hypothetical protein [Deltaproteobacteria bacterium]